MFGDDDLTVDEILENQSRDRHDRAAAEQIEDLGDAGMMAEERERDRRIDDLFSQLKLSSDLAPWGKPWKREDAAWMIDDLMADE
jgi:hypothetical protein